MAGVNTDIMGLLDQLSFGAQPDPSKPKSFIPPQPGSDPRAQAIQQYMEMKGAQSMPQMPAPREMAYPARAGKTQKMNSGAVGEMTDDMHDQFLNGPGEEEANMMFDESPRNRPQFDQPSYVTPEGKPSPEGQYQNSDDEDMLENIGTAIGTNTNYSDDELKQAQKEAFDEPTDSVLEEFVRKYGWRNLPQLSYPNHDDPADNK